MAELQNRGHDTRGQTSERPNLREANIIEHQTNQCPKVQGKTCLEAGLVLRPDLSRGRTCPKNFEAGLVQKLRGWTCPKRFRAGLVSRPDLSQHFRAGLVSRPDLSQDFEAGLVPALRGRTCPKHFRAGLVQNTSRLDLSRGRTCPRLLQGWTCPKTLGPEVTKTSEAGIVSRPVLVQGRTCLGASCSACNNSYFPVSLRYTHASLSLPQACFTR